MQKEGGNPLIEERRREKIMQIEEILEIAMKKEK